VDGWPVAESRGERFGGGSVGLVGRCVARSLAGETDQQRRGQRGGEGMTVVKLWKCYRLEDVVRVIARLRDAPDSYPGLVVVV
jgi:hypothetical protein